MEPSIRKSFSKSLTVQVVAIITKHSTESLNLVIGSEGYAVIKASDVMIATGD